MYFIGVLALNVGMAPLNELQLKFLPIIHDYFDSSHIPKVDGL